MLPLPIYIFFYQYASLKVWLLFYEMTHKSAERPAAEDPARQNETEAEKRYIEQEAMGREKE